MAYLTDATIQWILAHIGPAGLRRAFRDTILPKLKSEFDGNATGLADMPAAAGTLEASKLIQVDANKHIDEINATALKVGAAGAAVAITATPAEINALAGLALDDEFDALLNMETELGLLSGLTVASAVLNALNSNPGKRALNVLEIDSDDSADGDTITIGADVYEVDTEDVENVTGANIALDCSGDTTEKSQATFTVTVQPTSGETISLGVDAGAKVYTFVPDGTGNADGEIDVGADLAEAKLNIVGAIMGVAPQAHCDPHTQATMAAFSGNDSVLSAIIGGVVGDLIECTEAMANGSFDAGTFGTTNAGVDPLAAEVTDALIAAITASGTELVAAVDIGTAEVLIIADAVGVITIACTETLTGTGVWAAANMYGGSAAGGTAIVAQARVPNAVEASVANMHFQFDFNVAFVNVVIRATSTGIVLAWDGGITVTAGLVTIDNDGAADWDADDTVYVLAYA